MGLIGGLGLFLYGMTLMSDSLEKAAGAKLRGILELFTKNRYVGIIVGVVFTAIIQSSSAATVMVVSFVNAGLMTLYQVIGVNYGANIGTTVTSQLVSFDLQESDGEKSRRGCHRVWYPFPGNQYHVFFYGCFERTSGYPESVHVSGQPILCFAAWIGDHGDCTEFFCDSQYCASFGTAGITSAEDLFLYYSWMQYRCLYVSDACQPQWKEECQACSFNPFIIQYYRFHHYGSYSFDWFRLD